MNYDDLEVPWATGELPNERVLAGIGVQIAHSLQPVSTLPGDGRMIWLTWTAFLMLSLAASLALGYAGFRHLTVSERIAYYAPIAGFGWLFAVAAVQEVIPGSKQRIETRWLIVSCLLALTALVLLLFAIYPINHFVQLGWPCLALGTASAGVIGCFSYALVRSGFIVAPVRTGLVLGCFAGLAGVAVLAMHCPIQNAAHIAVWHFGSIVISGAAGWAIGWWRERR